MSASRLVMGSNNETMATLDSDFIQRAAIFLAVGHFVIMVLTSFTNGIMLTAVARFTTLRSTTNHFIASLSVADFLQGLTIPLYVAFLLSEPSSALQQSKYACLLRYTCIVATSNASLLNLVCIAANRYIAVQFSLRYTRLMTRGVVRGMLLFVWSFAGITLVLPLAGVNTWKEGHLCSFVDVLPMYYLWGFWFGPVIVCLITVLTLYIRILSTARAQIKRIRRSTSLLHLETKKFHLILYLNIIIWIPYLTMRPTLPQFEFFRSHENYLFLIREVTILLFRCNSFINPIIYGWNMKAMRPLFFKVLGIKRPLSGEPQPRQIKLFSIVHGGI